MSLYNEKNIKGVLWLRDANENVYNAQQALSSLYFKYEKIHENFYSDLIKNEIEKFDVFYDTLFVQTSSGYIFEKYKHEEGIIKPFNQINNFNLKQNNFDIDYWLNENKKIVYYFEFQNTPYIPVKIQENIATLNFAFKFNKFDLINGEAKTLINKNISLKLSPFNNLTNSNGIKENPKLTYNSDTNVFNSSFIIRNNINELGLISINFNEIEIIEINTFIPYGNVLIDI